MCNRCGHLADLEFDSRGIRYSNSLGTWKKKTWLLLYNSFDLQVVVVVSLIIEDPLLFCCGIMQLAIYSVFFSPLNMVKFRLLFGDRSEYNSSTFWIFVEWGQDFVDATC